MPPRVAAEMGREATTSENVLELVKGRLAGCSYQAVRSVFCEFRQGLLILRGRLPSFYYKQIAQEAVAGLAGVAEVVNQIEVVGLARC